MWSDTEASVGFCGGEACIAQENPSRRKQEIFMKP